jgi:hypothetical protein
MKALRCSPDNLVHVPTTIINDEMVEKAFISAHRLQYLPLIPARFWTEKFAYRALKSVKADYDERYHSRESSEQDVHRRCHVIMSLMPESLKTRSFYHGMFDEKMAPAVITALTPAKHRDREYYRLMAHYDVDRVPLKMLNYELIHIALGEEAKRSVDDLLKPEERREVIFRLMDNRLADTIVGKDPTNFTHLPDKFQTSTRLILAVKTAGKQGRSRMYHDDKLLTLNVVKEFIRQGIECDIPKKLWNEELVEFCVQHNKSVFWFTQIPAELQTKESVTVAVNYSMWNLQHALKQNITREVAIKVVREEVDDSRYRSRRGYVEYLPESYFTEFKKKTGLPELFLGGEVDYKTFKEERKSYTYCRIGNIYAGVHSEGFNHSTETNLIITRVDKRSAPRQLYEGHVGAFHKTWLEKPIAERDPMFIKPKVDPSLKDVQAVSYYDVKHIEQRDGFDIYANTFCGITVGYCAKKDGLTYHDDSVEAAITGWREKVEKARAAEAEEKEGGSAQSDSDAVVFTAEILHRKYRFCETGMTAFVNDYGLDYNGRYSVGYLRQVVALQGSKPSLRNYSRELRQIKVIS